MISHITVFFMGLCLGWAFAKIKNREKWVVLRRINMDRIITIQKINGLWMAGYIGKDKINHYLSDGKTKDDLIRRLGALLLDELEKGE